MREAQEPSVCGREGSGGGVKGPGSGEEFGEEGRKPGDVSDGE